MKCEPGIEPFLCQLLEVLDVTRRNFGKEPYLEVPMLGLITATSSSGFRAAIEAAGIGVAIVAATAGVGVGVGAGAFSGAHASDSTTTERRSDNIRLRPSVFVIVTLSPHQFL